MLSQLAEGGDPVLRARALWLLDSAGEKSAALKAARDPEPEVRELVRILASNGIESLHRADWLARDPDAGVRREVLLRLAASGSDEAWVLDWLLTLARQHDPADRYYREAVGIAMRGREDWAYRELANASQGKWNARLAELAFQLHPATAIDDAIAVVGDTSQTPERRAQAASVLGVIRDPRAAKALAVQLDGEAPREVQLAALKWLPLRDRAEVASSTTRCAMTRSWGRRSSLFARRGSARSRPI
jgi:hypothetical protein